MKEEYEDSAREAADAHASEKRQLEGKVRQLESEGNAELNKEIESLTAQVSELEAAKSDWETNEGGIVAQQTEQIQELKAELETARGSLKKMGTQLKEGKGGAKSDDKLAGEIGDLEDQIEALKQANIDVNAELDGTNSKLEASELHASKLEETVSDLRRQFKEISKVNVGLEQQRKSMSAEAKYRNILGVISKEISMRQSAGDGAESSIVRARTLSEELLIAEVASMDSGGGGEDQQSEEEIGTRHAEMVGLLASDEMRRGSHDSSDMPLSAEAVAEVKAAGGMASVDKLTRDVEVRSNEVRKLERNLDNTQRKLEEKSAAMSEVKGKLDELKKELSSQQDMNKRAMPFVNDIAGSDGHAMQSKAQELLGMYNGIIKAQSSMMSKSASVSLNALQAAALIKRSASSRKFKERGSRPGTSEGDERANSRLSSREGSREGSRPSSRASRGRSRSRADSGAPGDDPEESTKEAKRAAEAQEAAEKERTAALAAAKKAEEELAAAEAAEAEAHAHQEAARKRMAGATSEEEKATAEAELAAADEEVAVAVQAEIETHAHQDEAAAADELAAKHSKEAQAGESESERKAHAGESESERKARLLALADAKAAASPTDRRMSHFTSHQVDEAAHNEKGIDHVDEGYVATHNTAVEDEKAAAIEAEAHRQAEEAHEAEQAAAEQEEFAAMAEKAAAAAEAEAHAAKVAADAEAAAAAAEQAAAEAAAKAAEEEHAAAQAVAKKAEEELAAAEAAEAEAHAHQEAARKRMAEATSEEEKAVAEAELAAADEEVAVAMQAEAEAHAHQNEAAAADKLAAEHAEEARAADEAAIAHQQEAEAAEKAAEEAAAQAHADAESAHAAAAEAHAQAKQAHVEAQAAEKAEAQAHALAAAPQSPVNRTIDLDAVDDTSAPGMEEGGAKEAVVLIGDGEAPSEPSIPNAAPSEPAKPSEPRSDAQASVESAPSASSAPNAPHAPVAPAAQTAAALAAAKKAEEELAAAEAAEAEAHAHQEAARKRMAEATSEEEKATAEAELAAADEEVAVAVQAEIETHAHQDEAAAAVAAGGEPPARARRPSDEPPPSATHKRASTHHVEHHHKLSERRKSVAAMHTVQLRDDESDEEASLASFEVKKEPDLDEAMLGEVLNDEQKLSELLDVELDGSLQALTLACAHIHLRMETLERLETQVEKVQGKDSTSLDLLDEQFELLADKADALEEQIVALFDVHSLAAFTHELNIIMVKHKMLSAWRRMLNRNHVDKFSIVQTQISILNSSIEEKGGWEADLLDGETGVVNVEVDVEVWPTDVQAKMLSIIRDYLRHSSVEDQAHLAAARDEVRLATTQLETTKAALQRANKAAIEDAASGGKAALADLKQLKAKVEKLETAKEMLESENLEMSNELEWLKESDDLAVMTQSLHDERKEYCEYHIRFLNSFEAMATICKEDIYSTEIISEFHEGDRGHERPKDEIAARKYMIKQAIKELPEAVKKATAMLQDANAGMLAPGDNSVHVSIKQDARRMLGISKQVVDTYTLMKWKKEEEIKAKNKEIELLAKQMLGMQDDVEHLKAAYMSEKEEIIISKLREMAQHQQEEIHFLKFKVSVSSLDGRTPLPASAWPTLARTRPGPTPNV